MKKHDGLVLLTGATGYAGGHLLAALEESRRPVRCLSRRPERLSPRPASTEAVRGDLLDPESLADAFEGIETAYYLVHSLHSTGSFGDAERRSAAAFADGAAAAGVRRIVYLGGLGGGELSEHLASRRRVGRVLRDSGVPTIELRASIVVGAGSASFELIRTLVQKLPLLFAPHWVENMSQPIAIEDAVDYLVAALDVELHGTAVFEIGGSERDRTSS